MTTKIEMGVLPRKRGLAVGGLLALGLLALGCTDVETNGGSGSKGGASGTTNVTTGTAGSGVVGSGSAGTGGNTTPGTAGAPGTAGSTGTAGSSDTAGSTGTAGSFGVAGSTGTAGDVGTAGATGAGGAVVVTPPCAAPSTALITDFGAGKTAVGAAYKGADTGLAAPMVTTSTGALVIDLDTGVPTTPYPYAYVGLPFNACTGAGAYTGVKFKIGGKLTEGCSIQFSAVDQAHSTVANHGTCTSTNCYPSSARFELPATPTDVTVLFTDQSGGGADPGAATLDPAHLLNIQWQVNPATGDAGGGCKGTITIDNVTFM
jgi:hypothetical protein